MNPSSIKATDLILSGTALNGLAPAHATSLTWIDSHTVEFNLTGSFNTGGTLNVSLAQNTVQNSQGKGVVGYTDNAVLSVGAIVHPINPTGGNSGGGTTGNGSTPIAAPAPKAATAPKGPLHAKKKHPVVHHAKPVKHHVVVKPHKPVAKHKPVVAHKPAATHKVVAPKKKKG